MKILIAYVTYSGNTKEVAECIASELEVENLTVDMHRIEVDPFVDVSKYDYLFLGTFTWDYGETPIEIKDFVLDVGYKPENVAIFGTGDTQFGEEYQFCQAVDRLTRFYNSKWDGLKIEQSPRGSQEEKIKQWVKGVLQDVKSYA